jgi:hypothetical protein
LAEAVRRLLSGRTSVTHPLDAFCQAVGRVRNSPRAWEERIDWSELPDVRTLLDQFPLTPENPPVVVPHWDAEAGVLSYGLRPAREVKPDASNIHTVLDAFAEAGWQKKIPSPFEHAAQLHDTLKRLRAGLQYLQFSSERGAKKVCWSVGSTGT